MKKILFIAIAALALTVGAAAWYLTPASQYGASMTGAPLVPIENLLAESDRHLSADIRVRGRIVRQCPSAGCWFFLEASPGKQLRVELGHLGRTFPQKIGHSAEVEGRLLKSDKDLELVGNSVRFE